MGDVVAALRREGARLSRSGDGRRDYPRDFRRRVRSYVEDRRGAGVAWKRIGTELGLPVSTLSYWAAEGGVAERGDFRTVRVTQVPEGATRAPNGRTVTVVTPLGYRIEGVELADVVTLLRGLA